MRGVEPREVRRDRRRVPSREREATEDFGGPVGLEGEGGRVGVDRLRADKL